MEYTDYWVIIIFSLVIIIAGISFGRRGGDMKSFFAAGGAMPWSISGLSLFMSFFSAGTFVVWGSIAYSHGWVAITIQWTMLISGLIVGYWLAPGWRKTNVLTAAEFISRRFGRDTQKFYTYIFLFLSLGYTGAFLFPVAKLVNVSTGLSIELSILLLGTLILIYTAIGGLWAVVITDVLQFVILTAAVLIVIPLAFDHIGGVEKLFTASPAGFFDLVSGEYTWLFILAFTFYNTIFIGGNWAYVQRYTSVNNAKSASKVGYLFAGLYLLSPVIWMIPPMLYKLVDPSLGPQQAEGAYLLMCQQVLPIGMLGLMLGGMIFATASSVNTSLNLAAAVLTNDVYKPLRPQSSNRTLMQVARLSTLIFGLGTIGVALLVPAAGGIVEVVLSIGAVTGGSLYAPPIWGIFSKKITGKAILVITGLSLLVNVFFKLISPWLIDFSLSRAYEMLLGVSLPLGLLAGYEIYAHRKKKVSKQYKKYEEERNRLATLAKQEPVTKPDTQNAYGIKVLGISLAAVSIILLVLSLIAQKGIALLVILGLMILVLSFILIYYAGKNESPKKIIIK